MIRRRRIAFFASKEGEIEGEGGRGREKGRRDREK
jgi:hypothetical protein